MEIVKTGLVLFFLIIFWLAYHISILIVRIYFLVGLSYLLL